MLASISPGGGIPTVAILVVSGGLNSNRSSVSVPNVNIGF